MPSVFKRDRDQNDRHSRYTIEYRDETGKRRRKTAYTDYERSRRLAFRLEDEARQRRDGLVDGALDKAANEKRRPIGEQLAEFEASLACRETTSKHVKLTIFRIRKIIVEECQFGTVEDINGGKIEQCLRDLRREDDLGHRTHNHYVQALNSFGRWLVTTKGLTTNPFSALPRLNAEADVRHRRRALELHEIASLVESARSSGVRIQGYTGEQRARCYIFSYFTGLRRAEMASLTAESFKLDAQQPTLELEAGCSKHRRRDELPLHPDLVEMVRDWTAPLAPGEPLFPRLDRKKTWLMVKKDLERIGIPYETKDGIADFHATGRVSHITELLKGGVKLNVTKDLARHTDIRMTIRYDRSGLHEQARALQSLPVPESPSQQYGRNGCGSPCPDASANGANGDGKNVPSERAKPGSDRAYDSSCPSASSNGTEAALVEAAGIEPASRDISMEASTCVVASFNFRLPRPLATRSSVN